MNRFLKILCFTLVLLTVVSCTEKKDTSKTIRIVRNIGGREGFKIHFDAWKKTFEKNNPGWTLQLIDLGNSDASSYYKARITTGDVPEILQTWSLTKFLVESDILMPIEDSFYEKHGIEIPAPLDGKQYNSQGGLQFYGMAVNKKLWDDIGVTEPPKSWNEFVAALKKIKAKGHRALCYGGDDWSAATLLEFNLQANLYYTLVDGKSWNERRNTGEVTFASDPTAKIIMTNIVELLAEFTEKGVRSDGYSEQQNIFYNGEAATWIMGCWIGGELEPLKSEIDADYWPIPLMIDQSPTFLSNMKMQSGWAIHKNISDEKKQAALKVFDAFYEPEVYQLFLNGEAMFSTAKNVKGVEGPKSEWPPAQKLFDRMNENLKKHPLKNGWYLSLEDQPPTAMDWTRVMQEILGGEKDVNRLLKILDDDWDRAMKGQ